MANTNGCGTYLSFLADMAKAGAFTYGGRGDAATLPDTSAIGGQRAADEESGWRLSD